MTDSLRPRAHSLLQAATYWQFFLLRTLTGISVGGSFPLVYSLLGDLVPIESRSTVSAAVAIANGVGIAVGQVGAAAKTAVGMQCNACLLAGAGWQNCLASCKSVHLANWAARQCVMPCMCAAMLVHS